MWDKEKNTFTLPSFQSMSTGRTLGQSGAAHEMFPAYMFGALSNFGMSAKGGSEDTTTLSFMNALNSEKGFQKHL